ncbi:uncharacterized protein [Haliotis cracherodii]|uniref:uncharacterized protein n=1 Tax=Haliotis cracherodii TaxID=6455 RepID=UPI0039EC924D
MRGRQGSGRKTRREGHVSPSRREGKVVLPARRESVRIKKKMSSNSSEPKKVEKFMAKSVNPKSAKKMVTASTSGIRGGSDDGQGDDHTIHAKQDSASKKGSRVVCPEKEKTKTESIDKTPDKETTIKTESMNESPDINETNAGIMDKSSDKEITIKTESMDESPDINETNTGIMDKSSDQEITIKAESMDETLDINETNTGIMDKSSDKEITIKTESMDESPDINETNTGIMDKSCDNEDTKTRTESLDESPKNEVTKKGSRVESSDKQEVTTMADVMKESASPRMNPLDKCVHGNLVYRCGICFRLIDGLDMKVSSLRRGWHMCTMCHMGFRDPVMHRSHFVNFHKIVAPPSYQCPTCGARVEDNRIKEHMKLHEDRSVSPCHPHVPGIRHKYSSKNSAMSSTSVESSKLRNQMHTGTATISAKEKPTGVTSDCIKEHLAQGEEYGSSSQDPCQGASSECKEVMPGAILCHICGDDIENIGFEEHIRMHNKEKTQVQITQLCHLCGTDVARDALEKHMNLHENPPPTKSDDISRKPTHKRKCDDDEVPVAIPKVIPRNVLEMEHHELPKYVPKPVPDNVAGEGCCYTKKDPAENADHRLFNKMCAWHMCDVCNMGFRGHWWYKEHLLKVHDISKPTTSFCPTCGRNVGSEDMEMHVKAHERDETYVENDSGLVDDMRFPCSNCSESFSTFSVFRNHIKEHNQVVLVKEVALDFHLCNVCGSHVLGEDSLTAHASFHQAVESPNDCCISLFRCKICSITFDSNGRFIKHMETWHLKQFNFNITNKLHFDKYAVTVYKCVCSSIFLDFLDYKRHVKKKHPDVLEEQTPMEHTDIKEEGMILGEASGQKSKLMHTTTQTNHPDIDLRTPANKVFILNKQTTEMTRSKKQTCRNRRSVPGQVSSDGVVSSRESHPEHQDKGASEGPCHSQHELEGGCSSERRSNYEQGRVGSIESQTEDGDRASYLVLVQLPEAGGSFGGKIQEESKSDCKSVGDDDDGMNDKESTSSSPVEMNCTINGMTQMCLKSETNAAGKDNAMNLVLSIPNRSEFCSATEASNIQYVVGRDSSFRVVRKQSGRSETNHGIYKQIMNHGTKGHDLEVKIGKEQVGNRHSTPDSSIVGVEPKERGGMQNVVISTSGVNVSGATSSIDPSSMKVTRCDKEGAMIKISVKGLEGYCFCTQCGRIFGNEKDFVSHCKATMTHQIKTVYRKNVSKQNQFHHHRDVSLNLCSCGKLLVGQVDLNRHLQTYNGPVVVASSYSSRHLMCDCGTQTGDDARSCQVHIPSDRHMPWRNIRQFDKGVMVDQRDIKVTLALNFDPKTMEKDQALCTHFDVNMANNVQYVVEQDSSFRVAQKQSRKSEGKHGQNEQLFNHGMKGNVCDLDMEDAYFRAMIDKELVEDRHSTPDSVGVEPVVRGGGQDVVMSTSGVNMSGATSNIDPSSMKITRCDKEGAMIKISVQGLEGHCSCTLCGRIFGNESDFVSHCKVTMTHKILKTVHRKNLSKENLFHRYLSEVDKVNMGKKQSTCSSNTDVLKSIGGADVSLNLCSCGKLLVGQEDLDRHLRTYKGPDVVASSHSSRHLMCDCGTQSGDDARSCQGHIPSDRLRDWRNIRQTDKCVMADEQDIDVSLALNFDQLTVMKEWALCKTFDENMADNVQYVVELDSSFRIVRKQSGKLEAKYGSYEQLITCGTKEGRCDLNMQDAICRAKLSKEQIGDRHSTPDSVGVDPVERGGGQDVVMSTSGVNMSGATSSIDPSSMKVTRCDKEEAMIKIAVQGLEGYFSCAQCGRIFRNETEFVSHCKVTMVHKILKSVHRKNLSKESLFHQYLSEEEDIGQRIVNMENIESGEIKEGTCSSDSEMVDSTGGTDVSLNLCSCGKLLVGQEDLDRHLRTYRGPDVVGSSHKLRRMMCDCGTQTGDDARACQNHMSSSRCQDWRNIRQFDKGVMVGEQDINVTSPPVVNANIDIFVSVVGNGESDPTKIMIYKTNSTGENGPTVSNCTKEKGLNVSNSSGEKRSVSNSSGKKRRVSNSCGENGLTVSNSSGENGPGVLNSSGENGPGVINSSGENGPGISNSSLENGPGISNSSGENGPGVINSSGEIGPGVSNSSGENGPGVINSSGENGPGVSNSSGENGPGVSNSSGENGPGVSNSSGENGPGVSNSSGENGPGVSNSSGENGSLFDSSRGEEVKQEGPASVISGVSLSQSLLTTGDKTQQKCWSAGASTTSSSTSSSTPGMVEVHVCSLCRSVFLRKEDMLQHLSHHKSYICQCSVLFLDFASYMCHAQAKHKMAVSDKSPVLVNLLGHMPQISPTTKEEDKMIVDNFISKNFMSTQSHSEETLVQGVEAKGYFTCECYEIFASESEYHQHLKQVVSKGKHGRQKVEKWHHCSICPMAFATKFDLVLHQKTEHRKKMPMRLSSQSNDAKMKVEKTSAKARCGDCGINFDSVAGLQVHKLLYQGTFKCTHRQDQVRAEMLRGKLLDRGITFSAKVDKAGAWVSKDYTMLASKSDSQAVGMDIPNTEVEVRTDSSGHEAVSAPVERDRSPGSASEVNIATKVDTCGKTQEIYVIGSDGNTVIKTEPGAGNSVVDSDSFIITRNDDDIDDDIDDDDDDVGDDDDYDDDGGEDDGDDDGEGDQEDVGYNGHETTTSYPGSNCAVNPSEIIAPGFGFVGSDSTEWTMMVPMVTIKKEPEEGMESLQGSHPSLGGVDTEDDLVMTDVKVEPGEEAETGNDQTGSCADVGGEATEMLANSGGDGEDEELDNVQVKEEPVSDEDLSQADVGNMVYIHKSSRDIFDEHDKQQPEEGHPETTEQHVISPDTVKEKRPRGEIQPPGQQQTVTKQKSVKQQLVEKLQIIKQQKELAKLQPVKPPPVTKLRTVKQQLLAKRQLAKQQRLAGKHKPVKEEPPIEQQQPEVKQQPTKQRTKKEQLFAPKRPWIKIQPKLQPMTTRLSVTNTQPLIAKHKQPLIQIQTQPLIKLQHVEQQQPVVKLQHVAQQQPVVKLQQVAQQQPVVKLQHVAQQQPMVKLQQVAQQQPFVKLKAVAQQQPVVKLKAVAQQQPVVNLKAVAQQPAVVKLKAVAQQEPIVKVETGTQQQPVVKLQSVAQQQTGTQKQLVFKLHPVTQKQGMKVQTSPQQKAVTQLQGTPSLYRCGICDKAFGSPGALIVHVKTHSKKIDELNCFRCGKVSPTLKQAFEHMNTHDACSLDRPYGCPVCKKTFQRSWHLSGHLQTHKGLLTHGNVTMCAICGSQFKQASSLRKHMHCHMRESDKGLVELVEKVDPALMPVAESYPCEKCGLVFRSKNRKAVHVRYVHKRMALNKCKQCEKTFYSPSELERHTRTHTGEKPFGCDQCGKAFALSTTLKDHLRSHTGERPFKCSICLKSYSSSSILGRHKLTHVGERKFKCDICDKTFLYSNSLTVHMRTHTGDRPFTCNICGKTFTASCHYRVHMRIHTGEKPYKCMFCERQFNNYGSHYRHIRTHPEWKPSGEQESEDIPEVLEVKQEVTSIDSGDESDLEGKLLPFMLSSALKTKLLQTKSVPDERKVEEAKQYPEAVSPSAPSAAVSDDVKTSDSKSNIARSSVKGNLCSVILKSSEPLMSGKDVRPSRQQHIHTAAVYAKVIRTQATPVSPPEVALASIRENLKRPFAGPTTSPAKKVKVTGKRRKEEKETGPILNRSPSTSSIIAQMLQSQTDS